ncbi:photosystem Ii D1 C-terminal processing protease [Coccomyxa subellipsoidea C-169]|uniref:C-terminal processing peptidase n=1 Tax=Coccomyxa subellipsoidea (strain C-169) TaxID=574566 RepID=I0YZ44_COCSC|nr:photosystem Ii D1 C-terminal processing protease [Coccomyxa subellipsoidea C-169]EIE23663.1 photosystem Ii D1 C-terminal processing protease [Coccomyxa subellipsoidea C-169]|eukprot:XP_005648207.1 photosystem Ii D1 C-terminal processing protease [Coccomyxa subellipsoidea C-169]
MCLQAGLSLASIGLAAAFAFSTWEHALPAHAVTPEQLLFLEAWRAVDRAYVDKSFNGQSWFRLRERYMKEEAMNSTKETYAAIRKALATLDDPFTRFLEPTQYAALRRGTAGSVTGVGLEVGFDTKTSGSGNSLVVITPSAGGPAERAGIEPRDGVVAINDRQTQGLSLYEAGDLLQGTEGSEVTLTVRKHGQDTTKQLTLVREKINFNPVSSQLCSGASSSTISDGAGEAAASSSGSGKVGYIRVATFSKQTAENARNAIQKLKSEGADRFVLDVRNNGGGLFPAGVDVARMWLDSGEIVLIADSQGVRDSYEADGGALDATSPLSVLVNRGTASASEVLAGALKDNGRARIVGERTFGKGLIQTIVELSDGSGVAVTVARYQTPAGTDINKVGIQPDVTLGPDTMPPADGPGFCKFVASADAPQLFGPVRSKASVAADLVVSTR